MNIKLATQVNAPMEKVKANFTEKLFMKLNPPFPPVKLLRFDGCKAGDKVVLELNFLLLKQRWVSDIIEDEQTDGAWRFIDVGTKLPFFLKSWRHHHEVQRRQEASVIIDNIQFSTGTILTDLIMYPALLLQFFYRKPIYKRIFS